MSLYRTKLALRTVSEGNCFEHWRSKWARHKKQKEAVYRDLNEHRPMITSPCSIWLKRIAPRMLDYDNLVSSFKYIRDAIAEYIHPGLAPGRADDDKALTWSYEQGKGAPKEYAIVIEIV